MRLAQALPALLLLAALAPLSSCATTQVVKANSTPAIQATEPVPAGELLDIGIQPFDPRLPEDPEALEEALIIADVRRAESRFIAYHLKDTLEFTGHWGAVRVTPAPSNAVDLQVTGAILHSDGETLQVRVKARDATGKVWLSGTYKDGASKFNYQNLAEDPFQDLYNDIANDILRARQKLGSAKLQELKQVAQMRFARDLAPDAFGSYLKVRGSKARLAQLPAEGDPNLARVARIREQEHLFVDTLDDHYSRFYREVTPSYNAWRQATYEEAIRLRDAQRASRNRLIGGALLIAGGLAAGAKSDTWAEATGSAAVVTGGAGLISSGLALRKDAETHEQVLKELSQSLGSEIKPYVLDIEGRSIELTGTAQQQYAQWREILARIYAEETGQEPSVAP